MRNGLMAAAGALALALLGSACSGSGGIRATSGAQGIRGGYGQPSPPGQQPPGQQPPTSPPTSPPASPSTSAAPSESPAPSGSPSVSPSESAPAAGPVTINAKALSIGKVLVDAKGRTLYLFEKDKGLKGKSACDKACAAEWPPVLTTAKPTAGSGVKSEWLGTITLPDGKMQVTYHNWPLYYFVDDKAPGDTAGQGVTAFGAKWYVVAADKGDKLVK
jgi:predicted lipoprotein with Yx(FWY)xxD motif